MLDNLYFYVRFPGCSPFAILSAQILDEPLAQLEFMSAKSHLRLRDLGRRFLLTVKRRDLEKSSDGSRWLRRLRSLWASTYCRKQMLANWIPPFYFAASTETVPDKRNFPRPSPSTFAKQFSFVNSSAKSNWCDLWGFGRRFHLKIPLYSRYSSPDTSPLPPPDLHSKELFTHWLCKR
jgi:hypothetical protein